MTKHSVRVFPSKEKLAREDELAWKISSCAADKVAVEQKVEDMIVNRIIDNAAVAVASLNRQAVKTARAMALAHPASRNGSSGSSGATLFGINNRELFACEWAAWANGTAVRELDYHDTFLAEDYSHPGDNIPPILAVAQQCGAEGKQILRALATAYEIQISLVKGICLHAHKIDHIAHLGVSVAAGLGTLLNLPVEIIYQAIQQTLHVCCTTRQSRKGAISSWKAFAPAHAGKLAIEAVDRCMRGEGAPSPIYEGEDSVIAWMLDGPKASYTVPLPALGEAKRAILESYTKAHSAEYQSQALIDLAFRMGKKIKNFDDIKSIMIHTSHHTHYVIGTGAGDPQKMDPTASRETLDHSIMYIFAVALQDGRWHHEDSYAPHRAAREDTVRLWHKITTCEAPQWTQRYHETDPAKKAFGGRVVITFNDGTRLEDELAMADAHPLGARPYERQDYIKKFQTLAEGIVSQKESTRFLTSVQSLVKANHTQVMALNVQCDDDTVAPKKRDDKGIF